MDRTSLNMDSPHKCQNILGESMPSEMSQSYQQPLSYHEQARDHMVACQLQPVGVSDAKILESFASVPRELFTIDKNLSDEDLSVLYCDQDCAIGKGRYLMEPAVHARLLQETGPRLDDVVLNIGSSTGYSSAILSPLVSTVVALEADNELLEIAEQNLQTLGVCNVVSKAGPHQEGCKDHAPYSLIIINGAVGEVPSALLDQLGPDGRLVCVIKDAKSMVGRATLYIRGQDNSYSQRVLFDASIPYLPGFEAASSFAF